MENDTEAQSTQPRVVDGDNLVSMSSISKGDLIRWTATDGSTWLGRVATVTPSDNGLGVDLTFAADAEQSA